MQLRAIEPADWRIFRELRREALREAPYAFGSTLEEWSGESDTEERWRDRLTAVPLNVIAELEGKPAGMASGTYPNSNNAVELISMWVAPFARGRGISDALVEGVVQWAMDRGAQSIVLGVTRVNGRAIALYERQGFKPATGVITTSECQGELEMERILV